jgi:beta-mannosidase
MFERLFPPADYVDYADWAETTQYYQSYLLKVQIELLRRLKYRPTGGFCLSRLNDPAPAISSSIIGFDRVPKVAYDAVRAACAPVLVVGDPLPDTVEVGEPLSVDVHVVSDLRAPLDFAVVDAAASWVGGERRWRFGGSVPSDSVVKVGRIEFPVPDAPGPLTIDLEMTSGEITSANHYATIVV